MMSQLSSFAIFHVTQITIHLDREMLLLINYIVKKQDSIYQASNNST